MKATRFMRQPFVVTGYKVTKDNMEAIARWCQGHVIEDAERSFIRVPVSRAVHTKQTEAYVDCWVLKSRSSRGDDSFKVYTEEWLQKNFLEIPAGIEEEIPEEELVDEQSQCCDNNRVANNVRALPTQVGRRQMNFRTAP